MKTIYNQQQLFCLQELGGLTPLEKSLQMLQASNWYVQKDVTPEGAIRNLFFAHPGSIHMARLHHYICIIDATYRTNMYNRPLLHIVGQAANKATFAIGYCIMANETEEEYLWAIKQLKTVWHPAQTPEVFVTDKDKALRNALEEVFPDAQHHLCSWHISTNILAACKTYFPRDDAEAWPNFKKLWQKLASSKTVFLYDENLAAVQAHLRPHPKIWEYLEVNVLPVKEKFVVAWAGHHLHFGNLASNRAEGAHAQLKNFLPSAKCNILTLLKAVTTAVDTQLSFITQDLATQETKSLKNVPKPLQCLSRKISTQAMKLLMEQYTLMLDTNRPQEECSHTFTRGFGLPCHHRISAKLERNLPFTLDDIHPQWHLAYNPEADTVVSAQFDMNFSQNLHVTDHAGVPGSWGRHMGFYP